jgi:hypothetical protein
MPTITLSSPHLAKVSKDVADAFAELTRQLAAAQARYAALADTHDVVSARYRELRANNNAAVKRRLSIERYAARVLGGDDALDELSDRELMMRAILAVDASKASTLEGKADGYVLGVFDTVVGLHAAALRKTKLELVRGPRGAS